MHVSYRIFTYYILNILLKSYIVHIDVLAICKQFFPGRAKPALEAMCLGKSLLHRQREVVCLVIETLVCLSVPLIPPLIIPPLIPPLCVFLFSDSSPLKKLELRPSLAAKPCELQAQGLSQLRPLLHREQNPGVSFQPHLHASLLEESPACQENSPSLLRREGKAFVPSLFSIQRLLIALKKSLVLELKHASELENRNSFVGPLQLLQRRLSVCSKDLPLQRDWLEHHLQLWRHSCHTRSSRLEAVQETLQWSCAIS